MLRKYNHWCSNNLRLLREHIHKQLIIPFKDAFERAYSDAIENNGELYVGNHGELLTIEDATEYVTKGAFVEAIEDGIYGRD